MIVLLTSTFIRVIILYRLVQNRPPLGKTPPTLTSEPCHGGRFSLGDVKMQIDDVLEWARDGKWAIIETHPQIVEEAIQQLNDLRSGVLDKAIKELSYFEYLQNECERMKKLLNQ